MSKLIISTKLMNAKIRVVSNAGDSPILRIKDKSRNLKRDIDLVKAYIANDLSNQILNDAELNRIPGYDITVTLDYPDVAQFNGLEDVTELCNLIINHHLGTHTIQLMKLVGDIVLVTYNAITRQHAHLYHWANNDNLNIDSYNVNGERCASGTISTKSLTELLRLPDSDNPHAVNNILNTIEPSYYIVEFENGAEAQYRILNGEYEVTVIDINRQKLGTLHGNHLAEYIENYEMLVTFCKELPDVGSND